MILRLRLRIQTLWFKGCLKARFLWVILQQWLWFCAVEVL